ncbi:MAG: MBL fold metallo-hydrolase [Candidatus Magasanikbacteria bacterium]
MHISWLGNTAIKIQAKPFDKDITIVIDPYKPENGSFPRSLTPDIGLYTRGSEDSITLSGNPFILTTPGECETKGVLITTVQGEKAKDIKIRLDVEQISVGHLGFTNKQLTEKELEVLADVDILLIPVGGGNCYDAQAAAKAANSIEPKIIIPMAYKSDNDPKANSVEDFLKEMGASNGAPEKKYIIKKKNLPVEETQVIVLSKE